MVVETKIRYYPDQKYITLFNPNSGLFVRIEEPGEAEPFWSSHGPELMDISITGWCDRDCKFCYRDSGTNGNHISPPMYQRIIRNAAQVGVFQVALGGGNPNQHPAFCEILRMTREDFDIVPSYTTNGRGITDKIAEATAEYCGSVAISAYPPFDDLTNAIGVFSKYGLKPNIHFLMTSETITRAIRWLEKPPLFLNSISAIIFLNYKPIHHNPDPGLMAKHSPQLREFINLATTHNFDFKIGFDSCSTSGLVGQSSIPEACIEGCEAGRFSMYVSESGMMFPCSFMENAGFQGALFTGSNLLNYWKSDETMIEIRRRISSSNCGECPSVRLCLGGCPVFPEINLCSTSR